MKKNIGDKVNVVFYLNNLNGGGAERVIITLANKLSSSKDINLYLVVGEKKGPYMSEVSPDVKITFLNSRLKMLSIFKLAVFFRKKEINVVLSTITGSIIIAIVAKIICQIFYLRQVKFISREANTPSVEYKNFNLRGKFLLIVSRFLYRFSDSFVCVSSDSKDDFLKFHKIVDSSKVSVIYNPVDYEKIIKLASFQNELKAPWPAGTPYFIAVGRMTEQKNYAHLLKAFSNVRRKSVSKLIILGDGEERKFLVDLAKELGMEHDIWMPGFIENPFPYMKFSCALILSSKWEGLPNVIIQAILLGVPVVSYDCPSGPREIISNDGLGKLVKLGDLEGLEVAMCDTLQIGNERESGLKIHEAFRERFDSEVIVKQYEKKIIRCYNGDDKERLM